MFYLRKRELFERMLCIEYLTLIDLDDLWRIIERQVHEEDPRDMNLYKYFYWSAKEF